MLQKYQTATHQTYLSSSECTKTRFQPRLHPALDPAGDAYDAPTDITVGWGETPSTPARLDFGAFGSSNIGGAFSASIATFFLQVKDWRGMS